MKTAVSFDWASLLAAYKPAWLVDAKTIIAEAETRRSRSRYKAERTGTMSEASCICLRALSEAIKPKVAIEIGTFIGTSAIAMRAGHTYTCDMHNDCLPSDERVTTFPFQGSTAMLRVLSRRRDVRADLFFFDGRIQVEDIPFIQALSIARTVYAFDDYEGGEKGVVNVRRLQPHLPGHYFVRPAEDVCGLDSRTTIALLAPRRA